MDYFAVVKLQGTTVETLLSKNEDKYCEYVINTKTNKVLCVKLLKAMYGTLKAPLQWYTLFVDTLKDEGFTVNPYDNCVANKLINGSQFTTCWYVDDIKFSYKDENEVRKIISKFESKFGKMSVTHGTKHTYLGMNIEFKNKKVQMEIKEYLLDCIHDFSEVIKTAAKTPTTKSLMKTNKQSELLQNEQKETFHGLVHKLLHVSKRVRLDL